LVSTAEAKRRELLDARPAERENARVLSMLPRAAELYREQIEQGLGGDPAAAAKARAILRAGGTAAGCRNMWSG